MELAEEINEHDVTDYDFMFGGTGRLSITVDHDSGDVAKELDDRFIINIVARPSIMDPEEMIDREELVIFKKNLAFVSVKSRKQRMPTAEEAIATRKLVSAMVKTIQ